MELESTAGLFVGQCKRQGEGTALRFSGSPGAVRAVGSRGEPAVAIATATGAHAVPGSTRAVRSASAGPGNGYAGDDARRYDVSPHVGLTGGSMATAPARCGWRRAAT